MFWDGNGALGRAANPGDRGWPRILLGVFLACCLGSLAAGHPHVDTVAPATPPPQVLASACEIDYPPFCMVDEDGNATGFSIDLMRAALESVGHGVTFETGVWAEVRGRLERGEIDALPLVGRTPEREALFDFTFPYLTMHGSVVTRRDTVGIRSLEDLRGRRVAVMAGDNAEEFLRRGDRGIDLHTTDTFATALRELAAGRHDAVFVQQLVARRLLRELDLERSLEIHQPVPEFRQDFCFAVAEGNAGLLAALNEGLALVIADGTHRRLHAKWFSQYELPVDRPIIIGADVAYPPYEYLDEDGRPQGFAVDVSRAIAREMNLDIRFHLAPWEEVLEKLESGEIDAVQSMFFSQDRAARYAFTGSYSMSSYVAIVRQGEGAPPGTFEELRGLRLVAQRQSLAEEVLAANGLLGTTTLVASESEALRQLAAGEHDAAIGSRQVAYYWINREGWQNLVLGNRPLASTDISYAVMPGRTALASILQDGLATIKKSGEYKRIHDEWMGVHELPGASARELWRRTIQVAVPLLVLLVLLSLWSASLRRLVARRTAELERSVELQRRILESSSLPILTLDPSGTVTSWNAACERVFGWSAEEATGRLLPIVPEDQRDDLLRSIETVIGEGGIRGREVTRIHEDGHPIDVRISASPLYGAGGGVEAILGILEDITEQKRAREALAASEGRYRALFENNHAAMLLIDPADGSIVDANPAAAEYYGWDSAQLK